MRFYSRIPVGFSAINPTITVGKVLLDDLEWAGLTGIMQSLLSRRKSFEQVLPSSPPPEGNDHGHEHPAEEDLSRAAAWVEREAEEDEDLPQFPKVWKGKGKETDLYIVQNETDMPADGMTTYPPRQEDEAEERRVLENLQKWEHKEKQKRKLTRDASISLTPSQLPTSVMGNIGRRASLLWNRIGQRSKRPSGGEHRVLRGSETEGELGNIPLSHAEHSSSPLPLTTQIFSPATSTLSDPYSRRPSSGEEANDENPFEDPLTHPSEFSNDYGKETMAESMLMSDSSVPPTPDATLEANTGFSQRPILQARASSFATRSKRPLPPPQPLELPKPNSPPPRIETPNLNARPPDLNEVEQSPKEVRWWTDWLCGCSEGADRGGDNQAGRTNPFE